MKRRAHVQSGPAKEDSTKPSKSPKKSKPETTLPVGEVLHDTEGRAWSLDAVLAQGHRGPIYSSSPESSNSSEEYVIKIEPVDSGHLFKEFNFYQRVAKKKMIETWVKQQDLHHLGVPHLTGLGQHTHDGNKYRFVVLQRLGPDLQSLLEGSEALLSVQAIYWLGIRMLDCLEYIHDHDYVHGDVTATNILLGYNAGEIEDSEVYLVDYGLSYRYRIDGKQKPYQENPKLTSEGSTAFMSRDAHKGVAPTRRGDLEILGYCLLQWLCGRLPWEDKLADKNSVRDSKIKFMEDIPSFVKQCASRLESGEESLATDAMISYFNYVTSLKYEEQPDYNHLRQLLRDCLVELGIQDEWKPELISKNEVTRYRRPQHEKDIAVEITKEKPKGKQKGKTSKSDTDKRSTVIESSDKAISTRKSLRGGNSRKSQLPQTSKPEDIPVVAPETKSGKYSSTRRSKASKKVESHPDHPDPQSESRILPIHHVDEAVRTPQASYQSYQKVTPQASYPPNQKVTLNVGGKTFVTLMSTLQKYPSKLSEIASKQSLQDEIFLDRDPTYFPYILNYLRDEQTTLPDTNQDLRRLHEESVFYDLTPLTRRIEDLID